MADDIPEKGGFIPPHIARKKPDCDKAPVIPDPCKIRKRTKKKASYTDAECVPNEEKIICPSHETFIPTVPVETDVPVTITVPTPETSPSPPRENEETVSNDEVIVSCPDSQQTYDALPCKDDNTDGVPKPDSNGNFPSFGNSVQIPAGTFSVPKNSYSSEAEAKEAVNQIAEIAACRELDCYFANEFEEGSCEDLLTPDDISFLESIESRDLQNEVSKREAANPTLNYESISYVDPSPDLDHSLVKGPGMLDGGQDSSGNPTRSDKVTIQANVFLSKESQERAQEQASDLINESLLQNCFKCNPALKKDCPEGSEPNSGFVANECSFLGVPWSQDTEAKQFKEIQAEAIDFLGVSQCISLSVPDTGIPPIPCEQTFELINPNEEEDCGEGDAEYKKGDPSGDFNEPEPCHFTVELPKIPCPCGYTFELEVQQVPGASSVGQTLVSKSDEDCTMKVTLFIPEAPEIDEILIQDIINQQWFQNIVNNLVNNIANGVCVEGYEIKLDLENPNCTGTKPSTSGAKPDNHPDNGGDGALCTDCSEGSSPSAPAWSAGEIYNNGDIVSYNSQCYQVYDADYVAEDRNAAPDGQQGWELGSCGQDCFNRPPNTSFVKDLSGIDGSVTFNITVECTYNQNGDPQTIPANDQYVIAWWTHDSGQQEQEIIYLENPTRSVTKVVTEYSSVEFNPSGLPGEVPVWIYSAEADGEGPCEIPLKLEFPDICEEIKAVSITESEAPTPTDPTKPEDIGVVTIKSSKKEDVNGDGLENTVIANLAVRKKKAEDTEGKASGCCELGLKADNEIIIPDPCSDVGAANVDNSDLVVKIKQEQADPNGDGPELVTISTLVLAKKEDESEAGGCNIGVQVLEGEGGDGKEDPKEGGGTGSVLNEIILPPERGDPCESIDVRDQSDAVVRIMQRDPDDSDPDAPPVEKGTLKLLKFEEEDSEGNPICTFGIGATEPNSTAIVNEITLEVGASSVCDIIEVNEDTPQTITVSKFSGTTGSYDTIGFLKTHKEETSDACKLGLQYDDSVNDTQNSGTIQIPGAYATDSAVTALGTSEVKFVDANDATIETLTLESGKDDQKNDVFRLQPTTIKLPIFTDYEEAEIDVCTKSGIKRYTILVKK